MATVIMRGAVDDENVPPLARDSRVDHTSFGKTRPAKFPPFVFAVGKNACLVHRVAYVEADWYRFGNSGRTLVRLKRPVLHAHTVCGTFFRLEGRRSRTCHLPNPEAVQCGRCNGQLASFGKNGAATAAGLKRTEANVKLGCMVKGY